MRFGHPDSWCTWVEAGDKHARYGYSEFAALDSGSSDPLWRPEGIECRNAEVVHQVISVLSRILGIPGHGDCLRKRDLRQPAKSKRQGRQERFRSPNNPPIRLNLVVQRSEHLGDGSLLGEGWKRDANPDEFSLTDADNRGSCRSRKKFVTRGPPRERVEEIPPIQRGIVGPKCEKSLSEARLEVFTEIRHFT